MDRRTFVGVSAAAGALSPILHRTAAAQPQRAPKARNVVLVHGLFADGSCWSEVIARLQAARNQRDICAKPVDDPGRERGGGAARLGPAGRSDGAGRAFLFRHDRHRSRRRSRRLPHSSMSRRGHPMPARTIRHWRSNFRRRRPPRASSGPATTGSSARRLFCAISPATCRPRKRACSTRCRPRSIGRCSPARRRMRRGGPSRAGTRYPPRIGRSIRIWNGSWPSEWAPPRSR